MPSAPVSGNWSTMIGMTHDMFTPRPADDPTDPSPTNSSPAEPFPAIETFELPFGSTEELRQRWRALMGPLGFSESRLWVGIVDGDRMVPGMLPYLVLPTVPNARLIEMFMSQLVEVTDTVARVSIALLLTRPGSDGITPRDLGWAGLLVDTAGRLAVPLHPIHRANDVALETMPTPTESAA